MMKTGYRKNRIAALLTVSAAAVLLCACGKKQKAEPEPAAKVEADSPAARPRPEQNIRRTPERGNGMNTSLKFSGSPQNAESGEDKTVTVDRANIVPLSPEAAKPDFSADSKKMKFDPVTETPANSLAAQLTGSKNKAFRWQPQWETGTVTGVRLPDAVLSPDRSVFAFVETTGDAAGPYGSRIVLMNAHDWTFLKAIELPDRWIEKLVFVPGSARAAVLCRKQLTMKQPFGVAVIDLSTGRENGFQHIRDGAGKSFLATDKGFLYLTLPSEKALLILNSRTPEKEGEKLEVASAEPVLALSGDGRQLAAAGGTRIEVFRADARPRPLATIDLPERLPEGTLLFLTENRDFLFSPDRETGMKPFFVRAGIVRPADNSLVFLAEKSEDGKSVFLVIREENELRRIGTYTGKCEDNFNYAKAMPQVKMPGAIRKFFYLPETETFAILDGNGNFSLIRKKAKESQGKRVILFTNTRSR